MDEKPSLKKPKRIEQARDLILSYVDQHEAEDHPDGETCIGTRIGIVCFIGHCLGLNEEHFEGVTKSITWHNEMCENPEVSHDDRHHH